MFDGHLEERSSSTISQKIFDIFHERPKKIIKQLEETTKDKQQINMRQDTMLEGNLFRNVIVYSKVLQEKIHGKIPHRGTVGTCYKIMLWYWRNEESL